MDIYFSSGNLNDPGNWYSDSGLSAPAGTNPVDGDTVHLESGEPTTNFDTPLSGCHFIVSVNNVNLITNISSSTAEIRSSAVSGGINGDIAFYDSSALSVTASMIGNVTLNNSSSTIGGSQVNGNVTCLDTSSAFGNVTGNVILSGGSIISGSPSISGDVTANDSSTVGDCSLGGTLTVNGGSVIISGSSITVAYFLMNGANTGGSINVNQTGTFDNSTNGSSVAGSGSVLFTNSAINATGGNINVGGEVRFEDGSYSNQGAVSGVATYDLDSAEAQIASGFAPIAGTIDIEAPAGGGDILGAGLL